MLGCVMSMVDVISERIATKQVTIADFNDLIVETWASTTERLRRRTRTEVPGVATPSVVDPTELQKSGNTDPRRGRGRQNYRGWRKRKLDDQQRQEANKVAGKAIATGITAESIRSLSEDALIVLRDTHARMLRDRTYRMQLEARLAPPDATGRHLFSDDDLYAALLTIDGVLNG